MKAFKSRLYKVCFTVSVVFNVGAGYIYCHWLSHAVLVRKNTRFLVGDAEKSESEAGYRVCYADKHGILARQTDGSFYFYSPMHEDAVSFAQVRRRKVKNEEDGGLPAKRRYMLSARNFFTTWSYDETGRCEDVMFQYNDINRFEDKKGNGLVETNAWSPRLFYSQQTEQLKSRGVR